MPIKNRGLFDFNEIDTDPTLPEQKCIYCERVFKTKTFGKNRKQFCSAKCRTEFNSACRRYGRLQFEYGQIDIAKLRGRS